MISLYTNKCSRTKDNNKYINENGLYDVLTIRSRCITNAGEKTELRKNDDNN